MRILADENVPLASVRFLREAGHQVTWAFEEAPGESDARVLQRAVEEDAVLVTFDRDFGALVYAIGRPAPRAVVLLRFQPAHALEAGQALLALLEKAEIKLEGKLTVVEQDRIRQRPYPSMDAEASPQDA